MKTNRPEKCSITCYCILFIQGALIKKTNKVCACLNVLQTCQLYSPLFLLLNREAQPISHDKWHHGNVKPTEFSQWTTLGGASCHIPDIHTDFTVDQCPIWLLAAHTQLDSVSRPTVHSPIVQDPQTNLYDFLFPLLCKRSSQCKTGIYWFSPNKYNNNNNNNNSNKPAEIT